MTNDVDAMADLSIFALVARAQRAFARPRAPAAQSASRLSEAVRRLEARLGIRLLLRTTRSVAPDRGRRLAARPPASGARRSRQRARRVERAARQPARHLAPERAGQRGAAPSCRRSSTAFSPAYPDIVLEIVVDDNFVDLVASRLRRRHPLRRAAGAGHDRAAGRPAHRNASRWRRRPPISARRGMPQHPRDLLQHACLRGKFLSGAMLPMGVRTRRSTP